VDFYSFKGVQSAGICAVVADVRVVLAGFRVVLADFACLLAGFRCVLARFIGAFSLVYFGCTFDRFPDLAINNYLFRILWTLLLLSVVCRYFVESISVCCEKFGIPDDVAGATLMALGCNGPELFSNCIAIFVTCYISS